MAFPLVRAYQSWMHAKGSALFAIAALAVGIGSATAIFTVVNTLLFQPIPYPDGDRFVSLLNGSLKDPDSRSSISRAELDAYAQAQSLETVGWMQLGNRNLTAPGQPQHLTAVEVTAPLIRSLGVPPLIGRWFEETQDPVAVISHGLWQKLGADPNIVGKAITLSGKIHTVLGVTPQKFRFPLAGPYGDAPTDVWLPLSTKTTENPNATIYFAMAKMKPGVTIAQAQAEVESIAKVIVLRDPVGHRDYTGRLDLLRELFTKDIRQVLRLLLGAALVLLLLTCANVGGLLLARSVSRAQETAIRLALGANRTQLATMFFEEGLVVALIGAAAGLLLSQLLIRFMLGIASYIPHVGDFTIDWRVALFAAAAAIASSALASLAPLYQAMRMAPNDVLNEGVRASASARSRGITQGLVITEIALALALLAVSGTLLLDLRRLMQTNPGIDVSQVLTFHLTGPEEIMKQGGPRAQFQERIIRAIEAIPGVSDTGFVNQLPLAGCCYVTSVYVPGREDAISSAKQALMITTPGYYRALKIPLKRGRLLGTDQPPEGLLPILVNETAAAFYWPGQDALGAMCRLGGPKGTRAQVVGIVGNVRNDGLGKASVPEVHISYRVSYQNPMQFVVRSTLPIDRLTREVLGAIRNADPLQPVHEVRSMEQILLESLTLERVSGFMVSFFAFVALLLASLGVYGVVSFTVRQRVVEMGTRMALGAEPSQLLSLVVRSGLRMAAWGGLIGLAATLGAMWILPELIQLRQSGAIPILAAAAIIVLVTAGASIVPAWRASLLSPMVAIRNQQESLWLSARGSIRRMAAGIRDAMSEDQSRPVVSEGQLLQELVEASRGAASFHQAMQQALETIRQRISAQWIIVLDARPDGHFESHRPPLQLPPNGLLCARLQSLTVPLPISEADIAAWLRWAETNKPARTPELRILRDCGARLALGLRTRKDLNGILLTGPALDGTSFQIDERQLLASAAPQLALMIENGRLTDRIVEQEKLRRDLDLAAEVQRRLLPQKPPEIDAAQFAAMSLPARTVGGDYYDFLPLGDKQLGIALADVAGKGVAAALVMSVVQASLRMVASEGVHSLPQLAARVNRFLKTSTGSGSYATFFYAQLDEQSKLLRYVNAGHNPPYLVRALPSDIEELKTGGMVIGLFPQAVYEEGSVQLRSGDVLVAFTDGVTEALNPAEEEYGEERLQALLRDIAHLPAPEISTRIATALREWIRDAAQYDDLTFLVMKVT
ncbi:MAG: SpoIIE family protein phosphatase [Acidobacteria bacterium]|nr:SpoIIE family protein phosphatase [Acidobacteriota bacterium]